MKTFIIAAFAALSLATGAARKAAKMACENPMPIEAAENAETKPHETLTMTGGAATPEAAESSQSPLKLPLVNPRLVVSKSKRQIVLYAGGAVVRTYRVALGANPSGDKVRQGDRATPEGDFYICVKNARSNFYLSLGLSYPNAEDAERGLRDKLITRAERNAIVRAIQNKRRPPWNTALGGEIFIHGGGTDGDWTWGCIALANADIKELFDALPMGTSVRIEH
ncbi:MAG TPA: L,D-transpeptidase [Pyrinomonadaceae bacterium]|jgi:murein L,D-transpeptidase YafK|nr:L,D-transpeptidase [Pyrinomonadaceae bacterium]